MAGNLPAGVRSVLVVWHGDVLVVGGVVVVVARRIREVRGGRGKARALRLVAAQHR